MFFFCLGTLEPSTCLHIISSELEHPNLTKLDIEQNIKLTLHYSDMKPTIYLDTLIPRICKIATTSSDRKTKMAACELTHAIILYLIGTQNHKGRVWQELCRHMLQLGCDGDLAVQQMFEPLLMQIMHYMSHRSQLLSPGVTILFDCLMEGVSHASSAAVRDISARCLREFMAWTIKQTSHEQLAASPTSILMIVSKLKMYSFDSAQEKRSGAALAFNNLYQIIREEDTLLDSVWLDMMYTLCINYLMSEEFSGPLKIVMGDNDYEQISISLDHVARVIRERAHIFNKSNPARVVPIVFGGTTLRDAIKWLFKECGAKKPNYRHKCIALFQQLATCVAGVSSTRAFIQETQTTESILAVCEGDPANENGTGILARPNLEHVKHMQLSPSILIFTWLEHLLATLDCYIWLLGEGQVPDPAAIIRRSVVLNVITYFLNHVFNKSLVELIAFISPQSPTLLLAPTQNTTNVDFVDRIQKMQFIIIIRIFELLVKILPSCNQYLPKTFWHNCSSELLDVLVQLIFVPHTLAFDLTSIPITNKIPKCINDFIAALQKNAPATVTIQLNERINSELVER